MPKRIGEILQERGKLDPANLERALKLQEGESREKIGVILLRLGMVSGRDLADALADQLDLPVAMASDFPELPLLEERLSSKFLRDAQAVPLREDDEEVALAVADPTDSYVLNAVQMASGKRVRPYIAAPNEIDAALERLYGGGKSSMGAIVDNIQSRDEEQDWGDVEHLKDLASEAPVIRLVNLLLSKALESRASDIHIEPFENRLVVRYRIDGVLHEVESPPRRLSAAVISRVKIMASLDIAERRLPQDGRIKLRIQGKEIDLRVSTVPTMHGESVVMRILDKGGVPLDFASLGFEGPALERFINCLDQVHGILLVTGPTGSGKTTTLYTALDRLNKPDVKIVTVEDPVEYQMPGINQIQVKPQIELTFANALRSIVRQDPDIIMVGEIRDVETVRIAMQSALTGHMVLSTVHTNDAPSTINRLLDMGAEDYLLTSTVNGILAQRLVRTLCQKCRAPHEALPEVVEQMNLRRYVPEGRITLFKPVGCPECAGTGYWGRICIIEMMTMSDNLRSLIMRHATAGDLRAAAIMEGMETMFENGLRKSLAGLTTIEEVLRVTRED
ncbi:MAG TPA: type II secretion system ATPase GspE [Usitatibacter sp.]|nr:type II secretion system ATPase GspE [Usitatibacter sp.]